MTKYFWNNFMGLCVCVLCVIFMCVMSAHSLYKLCKRQINQRK